VPTRLILVGSDEFVIELDDNDEFAIEFDESVIGLDDSDEK